MGAMAMRFRRTLLPKGKGRNKSPVRLPETAVVMIPRRSLIGRVANEQLIRNLLANIPKWNPSVAVISDQYFKPEYQPNGPAKSAYLTINAPAKTLYSFGPLIEST
jgi:hypothetical protein